MIAVGAAVSTNYRWPYDHAHPDCWQRPHRGVALAHNDVRAWTGTLAFHSTPTQAEVDAHLANLAERGLDVTDKQPVLYSWGVCWESNVRPYIEVLSDWRDARQAKREWYADVA